MKTTTLSALSLVAAFAFTAPAFAATKPPAAPVSATATFSGDLIAAGVGYSWGKGVLTYQGKTYPFRAKGVTALGVGAEKITGTAEVYHLKTVADFNGVYGLAGVGGAVGTAGGGTAVLKNRKGVEMRLHAQDKGLEINLAISGVDLTLDK
jgi:hypothetical protein